MLMCFEMSELQLGAYSSLERAGTSLEEVGTSSLLAEERTSSLQGLVLDSASFAFLQKRTIAVGLL